MAQIAEENALNEAAPKKSKFGFSHKFVVALALICLSYTIFVAYSLANINGDQAVIDEEVKSVQAEMTKLEADQVEHLMVASQAVKKIEEVDIKWSEILTLLLDATPDDIVYRSYSGNENGTVTTAVLAQSFDRVADLIDVLDNKTFIKNVFVPSVVKGTSPTNAATYSFSLNVSFEK